MGGGGEIFRFQIRDFRRTAKRDLSGAGSPWAMAVVAEPRSRRRARPFEAQGKQAAPLRPGKLSPSWLRPRNSRRCATVCPCRPWASPSSVFRPSTFVRGLACLACSPPGVSPQAEVVADAPVLVSLPAEELAELALAFPPAAEGDSAVASRPALAEARASIAERVAEAHDPAARWDWLWADLPALAVHWAGDCPRRPAWR